MTILDIICVVIITELQLKSEHKPIQHLNDWKRKIVGLLTDQDPAREDPQVFWRRDAILSINEEREVRNTHTCSIFSKVLQLNQLQSPLDYPNLMGPRKSTLDTTGLDILKIHWLV